MVNQIYPSELQLNKANTSDTEVAFLDLHLSIFNEIVSAIIYDKLFFLSACAMGSFYAFLEKRRLLLTNFIASSCEFHSCTEGSDELAHMQPQRFSNNYKYKVERHSQPPILGHY